jgi:hypothetical protein
MNKEHRVHHEHRYVGNRNHVGIGKYVGPIRDGGYYYKNFYDELDPYYPYGNYLQSYIYQPTKSRPLWKTGIEYFPENIITFNGHVYKCLYHNFSNISNNPHTIYWQVIT